MSFGNKIIISLVTTICCITLTLTGCNTSTNSNNDTPSTASTGPSTTNPIKATISGTISLPASVSGKPYVVLVDTDTNGDNGYTSMTKGTANGTSFTYSLTDIAAGNYFVYAFIALNGTGDSGPQTGDYFAAYGASSLSGLPKTANVAVSATGTVTIDMSAFAYTSNSGGSSGSSKATISGTISLPASVSGKSYVVIVDTDIDGGNGTTSTTKGTANGTSFTYSLTDIAAGNYFVYAFIALNGTGDSGPQTGDYFAAYGASSLSGLPKTANVAVSATGTVTIDMSAFAYTSNSGGPSGGSSGGVRSAADFSSANTAITNGMNAILAAKTYTVTVTTITYPFSNYVDSASGYTVSGSLVQTGNACSGTLTLTGGIVKQMVFKNVATASATASGTCEITFTDSSTVYTYDYVAKTMTAK